MLAMVGAHKQARTRYLVGKAVLAAALVLAPEAAAARQDKAKNDRGSSAAGERRWVTPSRRSPACLLSPHTVRPSR